jgi:threonyl-tRNA synthetase
VHVTVLPITDRANDYAQRIVNDFRAAGLRVESNLRGEKIGAKIRDAQLQKIPFMLVVGDQEMQDGTVAVRERSRGDIGKMKLEDFRDAALALIKSRSMDNSQLAQVVAERAAEKPDAATTPHAG